MEMELVTSKHPQVIANHELFRKMSRGIIDKLRNDVRKFNMGDDYRIQAYDDIDVFVFHLPTLKKQQEHLERIAYVSSDEFRKDVDDAILNNIIKPLSDDDEDI